MMFSMYDYNLTASQLLPLPLLAAVNYSQTKLDCENHSTTFKHT